MLVKYFSKPNQTVKYFKNNEKNSISCNLTKKCFNQKNRECFKIARLYYGIKEYKYAKQYLANYLSEISDDPNAWKLMAEIAELDDNCQKAIDCYAKY